MKNLVLSSYALSGKYRDEVRNLSKEELEFLTLSELKSKGLLGIFKTLVRNRYEKIFISFEEKSSENILPTLKILGSLFRSRNVFIVNPEAKVSEHRKTESIGFLFSLIFINIKARLLALDAYLRLRYLMTAKRTEPLWRGNDVLYLKSNLWFGLKAGGSVGHIAGVVNGFFRLGYKIKFLGFEPPIMGDQGLDFCYVKIPKVLAFPSDLNSIVYSRELFKEGKKSSEEKGFVYQRLSLNNFSGVQLSRKLKIPLIVEYNGSEVWIAQNWGARFQYPKISALSEQVLLRHAHLVVTISEVLRDELIAMGVEAGRIVTYPNCIDERVFDPSIYSEEAQRRLRKDLKLDPDDRIATFIGTFGKWHGVDFLAEAIVELLKNHKSWVDKYKIKFLIVGDGLLMPKVKQILHTGGAEGYVTLPGLVDQHLAPLYLASSDILLSPHVKNQDGTRFFGSPTKLFEYMAMGKPIVAAELEQIGDVLRDKNQSFAIFYPPGDQAEFIRAFKSSVEDSNLASKLSAGVRNLALSKYLWSHHVNEIINGAKKNWVVRK